MTGRTRSGYAIALALAVLGAGGCGKGGDRNEAAADSTNLNLLAGSSSAVLSDTALGASTATSPPGVVPTPAPARAERAAPRKSTPTPAAPAAAARYTAASGTRLSLAANDEINSRTAKAGQTFTANVQADVKDAAGHVVIPAGSTVSGTVADVKAGGANSAGTLTLAINSVSVRGTSYPIDATVQSVSTVRQGRGITGKEAAKVGVGAAAGAIVGRIIGKDTKGAIIGGAVGAAAGAGVAAATRTVDVVLPAGAQIDITLNTPVTVAAR